MKKLTLLGLALSAAWLLIMAFIASQNWGSAKDMNLNEWGDFMAGMVAPLALLWLIIGYFQQGEELRLNTEALQLQQEELRQQVAATLEVAENAERQAKASEDFAQQTKLVQERIERENIIKIQPDFRSQGGQAGGAREEIVTKVMNSGFGEARDCVVKYDGPHILEFPDDQHIWQSAHLRNLILVPNPNAKSEIFPIKFSFAYTDELGQPRERAAEMIANFKLRVKIFSID